MHKRGEMYELPILKTLFIKQERALIPLRYVSNTVTPMIAADYSLGTVQGRKIQAELNRLPEVSRWR